ncbi:hypothetical protein D3C85_1427910 [compost metagenome]
MRAARIATHPFAFEQIGLVERGLRQHAGTKNGLVATRLHEARTREVRAFALRATQIGLVQPRIGERSPDQPRPRKHRAREVAAIEPRVAEVDVFEVRFREVGTAQIQAREVGADEAHACETTLTAGCGLKTPTQPP